VCPHEHECRCVETGVGKCMSISKRDEYVDCPPTTVDTMTNCGVYKLLENGTCALVVDSHTKCDDGIACTIDTCELGKCVNTPIECDDNNRYFFSCIFLILCADARMIDATRQPAHVYTPNSRVMMAIIAPKTDALSQPVHVFTNQ
jgi:hypothetical protein